MTESSSDVILVTGVGGGVGQSILKCLRDTNYKMFGADGDLLAAGLYAASKGFLIPYATKPDFIPVLVDLCQEHSVKLLFPGLDAELPPLCEAVESFRGIGTIVVVSSREVIRIGDDKLATVEFLRRNGLNAPDTYCATYEEMNSLKFPIVLKPRCGGARSRGLYVVNDEEQLQERLRSIDRSNYVIQTFLGGDEYTCATVSIGGKCLGPIVMRRTLRDGDTYKAVVEQNTVIEDQVRRAAELLQPFGACNFQLRLIYGVPTIFEINPRCSGTTHCRALAGFNEPEIIANFILRNQMPHFTIHPMTFLRYWNELAVENDEVERLKRGGFREGHSRRL